MERDTDYYRRRFADELAAAESSTSTEAENCHRQLATLYSRKLEALGVGRDNVSRLYPMGRRAA